MILLYKFIVNDFIIQIHYKWFYYWNSLQMILLCKSIANDFTMQIHCKWFCYTNVLKIILLYKWIKNYFNICIANYLTLQTYSNWFSNTNTLEMFKTIPQWYLIYTSMKKNNNFYKFLGSVLIYGWCSTRRFNIYEKMDFTISAPLIMQSKNIFIWKPRESF